MKRFSQIWNTLNTVLIVILAIWVFNKIDTKKYVYINTHEIFKNFEGREDLDVKFEQLKERHKSILDSMYLNVKNTGDSRQLKELQTLSRKFMDQETEVSERYTNQAWTQINTYLKSFGDEKGYDIGFGAGGQGTVMFADSSLNVTQEAIDFINAKYNGKNGYE